MRRSTNSMGNPNMKVKVFDFLLKKVGQNMWNRGSRRATVDFQCMYL